MNYLHICYHCQHEHLIKVTVAKGQPIEIEDIPTECHQCGSFFSSNISEQIHKYIEDTLQMTDN